MRTADAGGSLDRAVARCAHPPARAYVGLRAEDAS
jgi:hypothetical protein